MVGTEQLNCSSPIVLTTEHDNIIIMGVGSILRVFHAMKPHPQTQKGVFEYCL